MLDPTLTFEDNQSWNSGLVRPAGIKTSLPAVTTESLCPVEAKPVISHHTETEALTPSPSDPVSPPSVTTFPVNSTKNPAIATGHPFPPQEDFGGSVLLHTPSGSVSLWVMVTLKRTAWLTYVLSAVMLASLQTWEQCAKTTPASQGCFSQVFCHHKESLSDTPCLQPILLPALSFLITRVSPPPSGDLEGGEAKVQVK